MKRKFSSIECVSSSIFIGRNKVDLFTKVVKKHGENVTHLNLEFFDFDNFSKLIKILNRLPKLETFIFNSCRIVNKTLNIEPIIIPNLKALTFENSDPTLLKGFIANNLNSIKIAKIDKTSGEVLKFLLSCPKLQTIICKDLCSFKHMFPYKIDRMEINLVNYPFRVKTLKVYGSDDELASHNVYVFFKSQGKYLQELYLEAMIDVVVLRMIFNRLKKLKSLTVCVAGAESYDENFYNDFKPLYKLRSLKIDGANEDCLKTLLKNSPRLIMLEVEDLCSLDMLLEFNKNIKKLTVQSVEKINLKFENLEEFSVGKIADLDNLIEFLKINQKVKSLGINLFDNCQLDMLENIITQSRIYHLKIECSVAIGKEIYEKFKNNHFNLRSLTLLFYARPGNCIFREKLEKKEIKFKFSKENESFEIKSELYENNDSKSKF